MSPLYVALGVLAGILAGLFGVGGGVIMVIGMVSVMKLPFPTATGTSLGAMLLPVGAFGAFEYYRRGNLDVRAAMLLAAGLTVGAWVGARVAQHAPPVMVQRGFALFLMVMSVRMWVTAR
ncbi:MAG: sulfite exporter TauE/SafE family protein [Gemmatimonadales bacterium]|nr:sulfite exporter TauE/SafE family protein [Gemmatimonadales bacterium]